MLNDLIILRFIGTRGKLSTCTFATSSLRSTGNQLRIWERSGSMSPQYITDERSSVSNMLQTSSQLRRAKNLRKLESIMSTCLVCQLQIRLDSRMNLLNIRALPFHVFEHWLLLRYCSGEKLQKRHHWKFLNANYALLASR